MKKSFLISLFLSVFCVSSFALPGFTSFISDSSGEYVYYKDETFTRESYVGFLCYNEKTFQARYYAPSDKENPEKTVAALFTIDPEKSYFDMTGENVIIADYSNSDDIDIVNYLHELLYEMSYNRIEAGLITPSTNGYINCSSLYKMGYSTTQEFEQFDGNVKVVFDCIIPLFNIKNIVDEKGNSILKCVEIGKLSSSQDNSFDAFVQIPEIAKVKLNSLKTKKAASLPCTVENQKITLDKSWEKTDSAINMWIQDNDAVITIATYSIPESEPYFGLYYLIRSLLESKQSFYTNLEKVDLIFDKENVKIYSENYIPESSRVYYSIKYLTLNEDENYDFMSFASTKANYLGKRSYYDKLLKSYSNKN